MHYKFTIKFDRFLIIRKAAKKVKFRKIRIFRKSLRKYRHIKESIEESLNNGYN